MALKKAICKNLEKKKENVCRGPQLLITVVLKGFCLHATMTYWLGVGERVPTGTRLHVTYMYMHVELRTYMYHSNVNVCTYIPVLFGQRRASSSNLMSFSTLIFAAWILKM